MSIDLVKIDAKQVGSLWSVANCLSDVLLDVDEILISKKS